MYEQFASATYRQWADGYNTNLMRNKCSVAEINYMTIPTQGAVTPCGWGVRAGMVRVWVAVVTHERLRDKGLLFKLVLYEFIRLLHFTITYMNETKILDKSRS